MHSHQQWMGVMISPHLWHLLWIFQTPNVGFSSSDLSQKERNLFYRKYYYLQSTEKIAAEMGMTVRSVEGKLYRIKKKLRKMMGGDEDEV